MGLLMAAINGETEEVIRWLEKGANPNTKHTKDVLGWELRETTALHQAAERGHTACVVALLESGCNLRAREDSGATALYGWMKTVSKVPASIGLLPT
jgi:ankyrin repeat protein